MLKSSLVYEPLLYFFKFLICVGVNVILYSSKSSVVLSKLDVSWICLIASCPSVVFQLLATATLLGNRLDSFVKELLEKKGPEYVQLFVATPGYSEHHTGLAVDVALRQNGQIVEENEEKTVKLHMYEKLHTLLADFGFILRYPKGKEEVTVYRYEPWHIRYIQDVEKAHKIMDEGMSLEEFLGAKRMVMKPNNQQQ